MSGDQRLCAGFGERQDTCDNIAGGRWSPYFCPSCDEARVAHISSRMEKISAGFAPMRVSPQTEGGEE
jgi:hypothetical protein